MLPDRVDCPLIVEWTTDGDGRLCEIDSSWLQITGQGAESAKGEGWFDAFHDDDRTRMKTALREAAQSERSVQILARLRRADGQYRWAMTLGAPRRAQQGACAGYGGWIIDLEDRPGPELDETRQRLEAVMEAAPVGLCYTRGVSGDRVVGNGALRSQFEYIARHEISASSNDPQSPGRQVRYVRNGRELTDEKLPLQTAVREARAVEPQEIEVRLPSGRNWLMEASAAPIFAPDGRLLGGVAVTVDITERKRSLDALRASEERFRLLFETSRDGIVAVDMSGRILEANPAYQKMLGYSLDELKRLTYRDLTPAIWHEMEEKIVREHILPSGESEEYEKEYIRKDGSVFPVSLRAWTLLDGDGRIVGMRGIVRDITERKSAEAALRVSELRYRTLMEATRAVTWSCPPSGLNVEPQPEWMAFTGQTAAEMRGEGWSEAVHPDDRLAAAEKWRDAVERAAPFISEHRLRRRDGEWRWIRAQAAPIRDANGEIVEFFGMNLDITDRKAAEDALRQSERRFRQVAESLPQFIWTCQADGACDYISPQWVRYTGRREAEQLGYGWLQQVHPEDRQRVIDAWRATAAGGLQFDTEFRIRRHDGAYRWFRTLAVPMRDATGKVVKWFGSNTDIDDLKQAEEALRDSRRQLALALEAGQLGVWDWHIPSGEAQFGGDWAAMLGYDASELEPHVRTWEKLVHPDDREAVRSILSDHLEGRVDFYECEHRLRHKDGSWRWILARGRVVERDDDGQPIRATGTHTDVTARHNAEAALQEADRRKDEFIATLAHELRNPLAPISNAVHVLKRKYGDGHADSRLLDMMRRQVDHLVRLVDDLLEISRITLGKVELRKEGVLLSDFLRHALETCQPLLDKKGHQVFLNIADDPLWVFGDPVRLAQIAANVISNAAKYTPPGGRIEIETAREGHASVLRIRDNGVGIDGDMLPHVFDLFAQTDGQIRLSEGGLGIGLALVRKLVALHGGRIAAHSDGPGCGSEFTVWLPLHGAPGTAAASSEAAVRAEEDKTARVLVIDDDHDVADSLGLLLESLGARVRKAYGGLEGVGTIDAYDPDLVFVDIGMPDIDGYETARRIRAREQGRRLFLVALTGHGQEDDRRRALEAGFDLHLTKPAPIGELEKALRQIRAGQA